MFDTQTVYRDLKSQIALMRVVSEMSRTIDSRRSRKLSFAQQVKIDRYSNVKLLRRRLKSLLQTFQDQKRFITSVKEISLYHHYR